MIKAVIAGEAEIDDLLAMDEEEEVDEELWKDLMAQIEAEL